MNKRLEELANAELIRRISKFASQAKGGSASSATISTGDLVQEAFVRILNSQNASPNDEKHLYLILARAVRFVLTDYYRGKYSQKRQAMNVTLSFAENELASSSIPVVVLHEALIRLEVIDPEKAKIVELRYFGGLTLDETAEATGISTATVKRHWNIARAWLLDTIENDRQFH